MIISSYESFKIQLVEIHSFNNFLSYLRVSIYSWKIRVSIYSEKKGINLNVVYIGEKLKMGLTLEMKFSCFIVNLPRF